jgi:hypothetical protein
MLPLKPQVQAVSDGYISINSPQIREGVLPSAQAGDFGVPWGHDPTLSMNARGAQRGVIVRTVINKMTFDGSTKDPMQQAVRDALIAFMAATAQAQAEATKEAQRAGIVYAQSNDDGTKFRGRKPTFTRETFAAVQQLLAQGT